MRFQNFTSLECMRVVCGVRMGCGCVGVVEWGGFRVGVGELWWVGVDVLVG